LLAGRFNFKLETTIELLKSKTFKEKISMLYFSTFRLTKILKMLKNRDKKEITQPELKNWKY